MPGDGVAIVTGSNKGIGFAIVKNLCEKFDGTVYLTARDADRGLAAVESLKKSGLNPEFHQLDIDDIDSVMKFRDFLSEKHGGIDILVNNAGIAFKEDAKEPFGEQAEASVRVNFFGLLNICNALFPLLRPHGRVVNISSFVGILTVIPDKELRKELANPELQIYDLVRLMEEFVEAAKKGTHAERWGKSAYAVSKVGVSALTRIQQRELSGEDKEGVLVNHVNPGWVSTDMSSHKGQFTVEQGAEAPTYLALLPKGATSPKGDYVWHTKEIVDWVNGPTPSKY